MLSISTSEAEEGTEYRELTQIGPSASETIWRITTFRAPHVQVHESHNASVHAVLTVTVEVTGGRTQLNHHIDARMLPRLRPLGWLLEQIIRRHIANNMRQTLRQAKQIIEQEYGTGERTRSPQLPVDRTVPVS